MARAKNPFARVEERLDRNWPRAVTPKSLVIRPPASTAELAAFEGRYEVRLPNDVIRCYQHMNGSDHHTDLDASWMRFWPIQEWRRAAEVLASEPYASDEALSEWFVCADHAISSLLFAIDLSPARTGCVYCLFADQPLLVSLSFEEFVEKALDDPFALSLTRID